MTERSVYHWSMSGDAAPDKIFDRAPYDGAVQILNYKSSSDGKWLILGGLAARPTGGTPVDLAFLSGNLTRATYQASLVSSSCTLSSARCRSPRWMHMPARSPT